MSTPRPILDRLAGLETEYAVRFHPDAASTARPSNFSLYDKMIAELRRVLPAAPAHHIKKGFFLANGGAIWYEKVRPGADAGLFEGATPECRGPRRLLAHQRAQDGLLAGAARDVTTTGEVTLCKSDCDAWGNVYGAQENYELRLDPGWRQPFLVFGMLALFPVLILAGLGEAVVLLATLAYLAVAWAGFRLVLALRPGINPQRVRGWFFSREIQWIGEDPISGIHAMVPAWLEPVVFWSVRVVQAPFMLGLFALTHVAGYRDLRRQLLPFLVSRTVVCGAGRVTRDGRFQVAAKAGGLNCVTGMHATAIDRPVFNFGHWFKSIISNMDAARHGKMSPLPNSLRRLQISIGDSNLCEEAEYLRVGTTMLVLDVIEAGQMPPVPRLGRPLRALRRIIADPTLKARVRLSGGRRWTAIEIQGFYLDACRAFLAARPDAPGEAHDVVLRWQDVLDRLESNPTSLVGRVDWVTKRMLLDQCAAGEPWPVRKKVDLRYHELSADGYFQRLCAAGVVKPILTESEIESARHDPPPNSPATLRGRKIREHAGTGRIKANWEGVTFG